MTCADQSHVLDAAPETQATEFAIEQAEEQENPESQRTPRSSDKEAQQQAAPSPVAPAARTPRFKLLTWNDLRESPDPKWLVDDLLLEGSLSVIYGRPGAGKTFLALDMALSIATGQRWLDHDTMPGAVVYVVADPNPGLKQRVAAWAEARGVEVPEHLRFVNKAVQLHNAREVTQFLEALQTEIGQPIALVVFDTMARCFVGGEENSAKDMGKLVDGADRIRRKLGAAVLLVHHTTKDGWDYRGSSALLGAADTMIRVIATRDMVITISCEKQKDAGPFKPMTARLTDAYGSCVVEPAADDGLTSKELRCLKALADLNEGQGVRWGEWKDATYEAVGVGERTFDRYRKKLHQARLVHEEDGRYSLTSQGEAACGLQAGGAEAPAVQRADNLQPTVTQ
jgi:hypothetical protein